MSEIRIMTTPLLDHPCRKVAQLQLLNNVLLAGLDENALAELTPLLVVVDRNRGEFLRRQGDHRMNQYFVLEGLLKRIVTSREGRELTLRFADAGDMETDHDAWRLGTSSPHAIVCVSRSRVAHLPMQEWNEFLERHPQARRVFEDRVLRITSAMLSHAVTLQLLDAPSRVHNFSCRHPELVERLAQKELASHLNLSAETLSRLSRHPGKAVSSL
ncbi:MAG TPA: Crp/Fnr family transcriptional regulator [Albitalea sp.]|nr:Crp/Fnr family transcriptional regulator [Albitalea sp.]